MNDCNVLNRRLFFSHITALFAVPVSGLSARQSRQPGIFAQLETGDVPMAQATIPEWLRHWRSLPRLPVWDSLDATLTQLMRAAELSLPLTIRYDGGVTPGAVRTFTPALVFQTGDMDEDAAFPIYVSGWCHNRQAHRTLRVDRLQLICANDFTWTH